MKNFFYIAIFFFISTLFVSQNIFAQTSTIRGFLYDASSGEPVSYATVHLAGTQHGSMSDRNGGYVITMVPEGTYPLQITALGFEQLTDTIVVKADAILVKRYDLKPSSYSLEAIQVTAESQRNIQETRTSVISVTPKEMSKMPSIGGQPDFAQYLQVLPGIVSTGDQGGQLYIRGGTPSQNLMLLDGIVIFNPFHSIGLFSVFDADIMSSADVYTGGFSAEFGGRISSVMDVQTRDGNKKRFSGKVDINTFLSKVLLEGPIVKMTDKRKVSLSYLVSAKASYLEHSSKIFYSYVEKELPYNFLDIYGKLSLSANNGTKFNIFGFRFDDQMNYSSVANYNWQNWGLGTNFFIIPGTVPTTIEGSISYTNYYSKLNEKSIEEDVFVERMSDLNGFTANMKFNYFVGRSVFNVGFDLVGYTTRYPNFSEDEDNTTDLGVFVKYKYNFKDILLIEPSFRLQNYFSIGAYMPEPRLAIKYNISKKVRLKLAGGLYSQNFVSITSDRDVVNLFYGYWSSPSLSQLPTIYASETQKAVNTSVQKSQHIILGLELDVIKNLSINIEGYFKNFSPIVSANRYKQYSNSIFTSDELLLKDFIWEDGIAYGGDISLKFERKGIYIWAVYSLGWVTRDDGVVKYSPHFDRRHNVNILASYSFGKRKSWQADVRWNYGSGFPFTKTLAFFPYLNPSGGINSDIITSNEELSFLLSDLNTGRLPAYHRLDIGIKKIFYLGERHSIDLSFSITNLYNYQNIFYVNRTTNDIIYQLPFLYNFGVSWSF